MGLIAWFSFKEMIKSKSFQITMAILVVLTYGLAFSTEIIGFFKGESGKEQVNLCERSGVLNVQMMQEALDDYVWKSACLDEAQLRERLNNRTIIGAFELDLAAAKVTVNAKNPDRFLRDLPVVRTIAERIRTHLILMQSGVSQDVMTQINQPVTIERNQIFSDPNRDGADHKGLAENGGLIYLLLSLQYGLFGTYSMLVAASVAAEKGNRVKELLLTKTGSNALLFGKVLGIGAVGLLQFIIVFGSVVGAKTLMAGDVLAFGSITIDWAAIDGAFLLASILYILVGYFFFCVISACIGSFANRGEDVNQLSIPVTMLIIAGYFYALSSIEWVEQTNVIIASYVPFLSPFVMVMRMGVSDVPMVEWAGSLLILLATTVLFGWLSAKIYRIGSMVYGEKMTMKLIWRAFRGA